MTNILGLAMLSPLAHAYVLADEDRMCAVPVVSQVAPAPDAVGVPLDIEAFFQFEVGCQDSTWALELVEADTQEVVATREINDADSDDYGAIFSLQPHAELAPNTTYLLRATPVVGEGIVSETAFETGEGTMEGVSDDPEVIEILDAFAYRGEDGWVHVWATATPAPDPDGMSRMYFETPGHGGDARGQQIVADRDSVELSALFTHTETPREICVVAVQVDGLGDEHRSTELCAEVERRKNPYGCTAVPLQAGLLGLIAGLLGVMRRRT